MMRRPDPERLEQAAAWRARLAESADLHAAEFSSWLAQDPRNREAWRRVQGPWDVLGQQATAPGVIRLRRAALAHAHGIEMSSHLFPEFSVHLLGVTPTCHWLEYMDWANPVLRQPLTVEDGMARIPDRPGAGIEWDEEAVARYSA